MWKYLILHSLWFGNLFFVHFFDRSSARRFVFLSIFAAAAYLAVAVPMDPFAWTYYAALSLLVFRAAGQFKRWAEAGPRALDEEIRILSRRYEAEKNRLDEKTWEMDAMTRKAAEIADLYDKIKEMSGSLDNLETFLVFCEALAKNFSFQTARLLIYPDQADAPAGEPEKIYEIRSAHFRGIFDRGLYLKERHRVRGERLALDGPVVSRLRSAVKPLDHPGGLLEGAGGSEWPAFSAHPLFLDRHLHAVLFVIGVDSKDLPMISILVERFLSELRRVKYYERIETLAITDGLTEVFVRRHMVERLEGEIARCARFGLVFSFLMIDIDHFKTFNDQYGHLVGDVVLRQAAETVRKSVREVDLVGRYGGEEFGVLLIETDEAGALHVAERIRKAVADRTFQAYDEHLKVTVSIGSCTYSDKLNDAHLVVDAADSALYQAKRQGRNRVCLYRLAEGGADRV